MKARYITRLFYIVFIIISLFSPTQYKFIALNITLAYIPLELALLLKLFLPKRWFEWPLFLVFLTVFILMLPNTFYMMTDLIHLNHFGFDFLLGLNLIEWTNFALLTASVMFAAYCYVLIILELYHMMTSKWFRILVLLGMMILNGVGIYVGRFLRFHSVHVINHPFSVVWSTLKAIDTPAMIFITLIVGLQALLLIFVKGVRSHS
ncbi:DUF1361 domain-containing protein [Staphylococcus schleiferi subsp. coagulans]|uniref:DUF1361 domain-containing protein n=1 Tax=Staphylococcus coagulans TaxID=74706 RepID=UPI0015F92D69|nr:DUF1361 domain-containing protein [Staphylococcus coagulans]MBA8759612.1 DUF1361 domain-containing protein [Staphylococcus coagulans]MBA8767608.1 DUF1361 domain-containing protein [Staphylococcus coagulans]